jgi:hypothetical protein
VASRATPPLPDTPATEQNASAAASWAGFPDLTGLKVRHLYHEEVRQEAWLALWEGSPEAVEQVLSAGGFAAQLRPCSEPYIDGIGTTKLIDCRSGRDEWQRPGGDVVVRAVTRGALADGTYVLYLDSRAYRPTPGTTG